MVKKVVATVAVLLFGLSTSIAAPYDGSVLPFPVTPSASVAQPRLQDSVHKRRVEPNRLAADVPNILIILIDDSGFGVPDTFGGIAHTPTLTKLRYDETIPASDCFTIWSARGKPPLPAWRRRSG